MQKASITAVIAMLLVFLRCCGTGAGQIQGGDVVPTQETQSTWETSASEPQESEPGSTDDGLDGNEGDLDIGG